jgi:amidase
VKSATHAVADLCAARGHDVKPAAWNIDGDKYAAAFTLVWAAIAAGAVMQGQTVRPGVALDEIFEPLTLGLADRYNSAPEGAMAGAVAFIQDVEARYHRVFNEFDVILTPVLASTPPPIGELAPSRGMAAFDRVRDYVAYTPLQNGAGAPAMSVPLSMSPTGMPIGAHFAAARGQERILLELAYELEQAAPWAQRKPPVFAG